MSIKAENWALALVERLPKVAFQVLSKRCQLAGDAARSWISQPELARRTGWKLRAVKYADELLAAAELLIPDGWHWQPIAEHPRGGVRTRRYRLPIGEPLTRLAELESARGALSPRLESARGALSTDLESARGALSTGQKRGDPSGSKVHATTLESAPGAPNRKDRTVVAGAAEGLPLEPAAAPIDGRATNVIPVAARRLVTARELAELTPQQIAATIDRRQRALPLLSPVRSTAAHEASKDGATEKPAITSRAVALLEVEAQARAVADERRRRDAEKQARLKARFDGWRHPA